MVGVLLMGSLSAILVALLLQACSSNSAASTVLGVNTFAGLFQRAGLALPRGIVHIWPGPAGIRAAAFCGGALGVALADN